ncbi:PfkB family carbohydrate kinase [Cytobacillus oceanisediminis]|uniref:Fructoselysine 6-kinase n=1 Tax=Cytobacillus oceanisediminis TaxID=665099 RepID=A0A562JL04_9BACI|nr:PfkB family carbohydrate kinase [Cytobacillus oceanisediminis]TWH84002.1 fructoselysine 6-kinase [Cytobacillus oceanisediminis]
MRLIAIGDNVVDVYKDRNEMFPGGNALNVAVLSKQYGAEETAFIGIVGNDAEGEHIIESLKLNKVEISKIRKAYGESGKAYVDLNDEGDRIFVKSNKGGIQSKLKLKLAEDDYDYIKTYDVLHTSIYSSLDDQLEKLSGAIPISYDFSNHFTDELLRRVCPYINFAFVSGSDYSDEEIEKLMNKIHELGCLNAVITRGSKGVVMSDGTNRYNQGIEEANVIDTLGAGDSFIAGFLTHRLNGNPIEESLQIAAYRAARTCEVHGAFGFGKALVG